MSISTNIRIFVTTLCLALFSASSIAGNTYVINDPQEITAFLSGYDVKTVTFTLDINDTLTLEIEPYGVPGDADGDGNPNASSNPLIFDEPGVGSTEFLLVGMVCSNLSVCIPDVTFQYTQNTLTVDNPAAGPASMVVGTNAYTLTIPNFTQFKTNLGGSPGLFGTFSFTASFTDLFDEDLAPNGDVNNNPVCEPVSLEPPVAGNDPFDCYAVNKVTVKDRAGTDKDEIKVTKAGFRLDAPNTVDLSVDAVTISLDGLEFIFPPGSFEQKGSKPDYVYKSASGVKPKVEARLNFVKATWELKVKDGDATLIDNSDGVDVSLTINGFSGSENVLLSAKGDKLEYQADPKTSCRHVTSDSSDSGTPAAGKMSCISSMTVQHSSGAQITKGMVTADLFHPNTVFTDVTTGDMGIFHTSCSRCLMCGDVDGNFTIVEIDGTAGDKLAQKCLVPDASCSITLP